MTQKGCGNLKLRSFLVVAMFLFAGTVGSEIVTRADVRRHIEESITFIGPMAEAPPDQRARVISSLSIGMHAAELIPENMESASQAALTRLFQDTKLQIDIEDDAYNRALVRKLLADFRLNLYGANLTPQPTPEQASRMKNSIDESLLYAQEQIRREFGDVLGEERIARVMEDRRQELLRALDNPVVYWMKQPLTPESSEKLKQYYGEGLKQQLEELKMALTQISPAMGLDEQSINRKLDEFTLRLFYPMRTLLLNESSPPALRDMNPNDIMPEYKEIMAEFVFESERVNQKMIDAIIAEDTKRSFEYYERSLEVISDNIRKYEDNLSLNLEDPEAVLAPLRKEEPKIAPATEPAPTESNSMLLLIVILACAVAVGGVLVLKSKASR